MVISGSKRVSENLAHSFNKFLYSFSFLRFNFYFVVVAVQSGTSLSLPEARFEIPEASGYHRRPTLAARAEVPSKVNLSLGPR